MSCCHAVDVDRSRARFSSMCYWTLKQNVWDVFWLPRIPGDIIIPSLSFLSPPPQPPPSPSPPLGLYVPLSAEYSLCSIACTYFGANGCPGLTGEIASTSSLSSGQVTSWEKAAQLSYILRFFTILEHIKYLFGSSKRTNKILSGFCRLIYWRRPASLSEDPFSISFQQ